MAVRVVDRLEVIEVEEDQRQRPLVAARTLELALQLLVELALVEDLGQAVADGQLIERLVVGVLDVELLQELEVHRPDLKSIATPERSTRW